MDPNDVNSPGYVLLPVWKPDGYSRRMAVRNFLRANPFFAALTGVGVRPAPMGASESEGVKTDRWLPPQQFFRSTVGPVSDPAIKNVQPYESYPNTTAPGVPPWMAEWSAHQLMGRG